MVTVLITVIAAEVKDNVVEEADADAIETEVVGLPEDSLEVTTRTTAEVLVDMPDFKLDMTLSRLLIKELRLAAEALTTGLALETAAATLATEATLVGLDAIIDGIGVEEFAASNC